MGHKANNIIEFIDVRTVVVDCGVADRAAILDTLIARRVGYIQCYDAIDFLSVGKISCDLTLVLCDTMDTYIEKILMHVREINVSKARSCVLFSGFQSVDVVQRLQTSADVVMFMSSLDLTSKRIERIVRALNDKSLSTDVIIGDASRHPDSGDVDQN